MRKIFIILLVCLCVNNLFAQCFDMTNLKDPNVTCTYGSFHNPYKYVGVVDYGPSNSRSRHTVNTDVNAKDPIINDLFVIPNGETSSIRLGNWEVGAEAESVTYSYIVDSETPILLLKYAAVMENPRHNLSNQPRLTLNVYDSDNMLVDLKCMSFDFISSVDLGWNSLNDGSLFWIDWTFVGIDLSSYVGQNLKIQITNYDCEQKGHYGYFYFHLSCKEKKIKSLACGNNGYTTFWAPEGFEYKWYYFDGLNKIEKGSEQTLTVPLDGTEYFCDINQVGNSDCLYTLSAVANSRYPIADFSIRQISECVDTLYLTNLSAVSIDGIKKNIPYEDCDEAIWDLGDGRKINQYDISDTPIFYADGGTYTIKLTAKLLGEDNCIDVYSKTVTVKGYKDVYESEFDATICKGDVYDFRGRILTESGVYYDSIKTEYGCDSVCKLNLYVNETYLYDNYIELCEGDVFLFRGKEIYEPGIYYDSLKTVSGCDSVYKLIYNIATSYVFEFKDSICSNKFYDFRGKKINKSGVYYDSLKTVSGCDSIYKLTLKVIPSYLFKTKEVICSSDTLFYRDFDLNETKIYYDSLVTDCGCDSVYMLDLTIYNTFFSEEIASICDYERYYFRGNLYNKSGIYWDSLVTSHGCDSIYKLDLRVTPTYRDTIFDTICLGEEYNFRGRILKQAGNYVDTTYNTTSNSCEIINLYLQTNPNTIIEYVKTSEVCADDLLYEIMYKYHGATPISYSIYYDDKAQAEGFRNVINRPFTGHVFDTLPQFGVDYIRPDYYNARLEFNNSACDPSVNGYDFQLLVKYPSWIIEQNWNDVVAILNENYNGGYTFDKYEWYVNDILSNEYKGVYLYSNNINLGDKVVVVLTREGESYSIPTCPIIIEDRSCYEQSEYPVLLTTTKKTKQNSRIGIDARDDGYYALYDTYGRLICKDSYREGDSFELQIPDVSGCYILYLNTKTHGSKYEKIIKY